MEMITDGMKLMQALGLYSFTKAPAEIAERLQTTPGVDADKISLACDLLYAHFDILDEAGLTMLGQLWGYTLSQKWSIFNVDGRAEKIVDMANKKLAGKVAKAADAPEPKVNLREDGVDWRNPEPAPEVVAE